MGNRRQAKSDAMFFKGALIISAVALVANAQQQSDLLEQLRRAGFDVAHEGSSGRIILSQQKQQQQPARYQTTTGGEASANVQLRSVTSNDYYTPTRSATQSNAVYPQRAYEYGYQLDDTNGSHGHIEKRDESGRVEGEYSINLGDGRVRVVKYVADENGYRADVSTDELGTESKNPNDVYIGSTAISGYEAALKYGPFAPPHYDPPLEPAPRPEAPRPIQIQRANTQVNLPTYGTFAALG